MILQVEIEFGPTRQDVAGRWAYLTIGGIRLFEELVYDTNEGGARTEEQAARNLLLLFAARLREVVKP